MKFKIIMSVVFIIVLCISILTTYFLVSSNYKDLYQVGQWVQQGRLHVESFSVRTEAEELSMFDTGFNVKMKICGYLQDFGNGYELYIKKVHVSERIEVENGKKVAYIKLTPIVGNNLKKKVSDYCGVFEYEFEYRLHTFLPSGVNRYVVQCEGHEQIIEVVQNK